MSERIHADVMRALGTVIDPCSVFNRTHMSLVDLGMVDEVAVGEEGRVHVRLLLDDPTCIFFFEIHRLLTEAVSSVKGVTEIDVEIKADEVWTEDRISPRGRARIERIRSERRRACDSPGGPVPGWPLPMVAAESTAAAPSPLCGEAGR